MTNVLPTSKTSLILFSVLTVMACATLTAAQSPDCGFAMPSGATLAELSDAIKANPNDANAYFERGKALTIARRYTQALKDFKKAVDLDSNFAKAYYYRGYLYNELANYKRTIEELNRAIQLNPNLVGAWSLRASASRKLGDLQSAVSDVNRSIELDNNDYETYSDRGLIYVQLRKSDEAKRDFEKAIEILNRRIENPENAICTAGYYVDRGWTEYYLGKDADAENDLNLAKEIDPQNARIYFYLGQIYLNRNEHKYSVDALTRSAELIPEHAEIYEIRARAYDGLKEREKAAADRKKFDELSNPKEISTPVKPKSDLIDAKKGAVPK